MPQLVPFFFVNQVIYTFVAIAGLIYFFSKYMLPRQVRERLSRIFIARLG